jgi:hypothetical protein
LPVRARQPLLNWRPVAVAAGGGLFLVAGVLAWAVSHPARRPQKVVLIDPALTTAPNPSTDQRPIDSFSGTVGRNVVPGSTKPSPTSDEAVAWTRGGPVVEVPVADAAAPACQTFGTSVEFDSNPTRAAKRAAESARLLVVLHISGNFEDAAFT